MGQISVMQQRDLILVPFPFSDQSGKKVRPALVISNDIFNKNSEDILVVAVTSTLKDEAYSTLISHSDIEEGILHDKCYAKAENILKIDKKLAIKKIGIVKQKKFKEIIDIVYIIIS